jgi:hypothetical protein
MGGSDMILRLAADGDSRPTSTGGPGYRSVPVAARTSIRLALDLIRLDSGATRLRSVECPTCGGTLSLHQPDEVSPDRLLAVCEGCQSWLLIDVAEAIMVRLPDRRTIRDARAASMGPAESESTR